MIAKLLSKFTAPSDTPRTRLRAAQAALKDAERVLSERSAESSHVRSLMRAADAAEDEQRAAEDAVIAATKAWGQSGATGDVPEHIRTLTAAAQAARDKAYAARLLAKGLSASLSTEVWDVGQSRFATGNLTPPHAEAKTARDQAAQVLQLCVREVLLEEAGPILARAEAFRDALAAELPAILGLATTLRMAQSVHPFAGDPRGLMSQLSRLASAFPELQTLQRFNIGGPAPTELKRPWVDLGTALATDAAAELNLTPRDAEVHAA